MQVTPHPSTSSNTITIRVADLQHHVDPQSSTTGAISSALTILNDMGGSGTTVKTWWKITIFY